MPIRGYCGGEPIPNLGALPPERWREVLRPLRPQTRRHAVNTVSFRDAMVVLEILGGLQIEDGDDRARRDEAPPPRMPSGADVAAPPSSRQVNFRLGPSEHERLVEAAKLFAMRPTTLARVLTMRGVDLALYEERRDR